MLELKKIGIALHGYDVIDAQSKPQIILLVKYGISDPIVETKIWSTPVYNYLPGTSATVNSYGSQGYISSTVTTPGRMAYGGQNVQSSTEKTYRRYLSLEIVDNNILQKSKKIEQLWKANISSIGVTDNLQSAVNVMTVAVEQYLGHESLGLQTVFINSRDPRMGIFQNY